MASVEQNANGKWTITKLNHELEENVAIPLKLWYNGRNMVKTTVSNDSGRRAIATAWETPIGTPINTSAITWETGTVVSDDGTKSYSIVNVFWSGVTPYHEDVTVKNVGLTVDASQDEETIDVRVVNVGIVGLVDQAQPEEISGSIVGEGIQNNE